MKLVAVVLAVAMVLPARLGAGAAGPACLPAVAASLLYEVKGKGGFPVGFKRIMALKLRLLGFSRSGRVALLEQREGTDGPPDWSFVLRIIDLDADREVAQAEMQTFKNTPQAECRAFGDKIRRILAEHKVKASPLPTLAPTSVEAAGDVVSVEIRKRADDDYGVTRHEVWLKSHQGTKRLGVLREIAWSVDAYPIGPPVVIGVLRSPWEPRLAVLIRQDESQAEGEIYPRIHVLGARLDSRWRPPR